MKIEDIKYVLENVLTVLALIAGIIISMILIAFMISHPYIIANCK
jgi:hypothetical protein